MKRERLSGTESRYALELMTSMWHFAGSIIKKVNWHHKIKTGVITDFI
jgi:hypothetical protein